ncbi:MAG: dihydroorotase [Clostridiales bacterium]|jgi:dihydroorotase|nr:dihydroorotase [Clostridiales bacterium]
MRLHIQDGFVVRDDSIVKEDIFIDNGRAVRPDADFRADEIIDARGLYVMRGFIDMHTHLREPGFEYKEDVASGTAAALKGGFTAVCCMPNTNPPADNPAVIAYIKERAAAADNCRVYPIGTITKGQKGGEITEMYRLKQAGAVALSDDGYPVESGGVMRLALEYAKTVGIPLICHEEDTDIAAAGVVNEGYSATVSGLRGISRAAEEVMIARDVILAESLDASVHIAHVSTKGGLEIIRNAKKRGVKVTCETCPHYFAANDGLILSFDTNTKVNPPLRGEDDRLAVIAAIKDGTVDAIVTDHAPHHINDKFVEYNYAANGISGLETAFQLANTFLVKKSGASLSALSKLMSANPARILGLDKKPEYAEADFTVVDTETPSKIDVKSFVSKGKNSPFDGWDVYGSVRYTIVGGRVKYGSGGK